jgi:dTDP-4-dehydrorhamnose 3,5-epimerase
MIFTETRLQGAYLIEPELRQDERGFFARTWCQNEFAIKSLPTQWVQCNISFNRQRGTLRGLHFQTAPYEEAKLVRCTMGGIYDVIVDLRVDSPTFGQWLAVELTAQNRLMLFIPTGFAHGFQTLADEVEVFYQMSAFYAPECARGVRWDDPAFQISWPVERRIISERDRSFPDFLP